ncbi:uncharacterized protein UHOD_11442 [Ustilago sp. UG-2017b]|nr:uncharacterized protein UHOD_11442 [Ustilago sp. UG-2017b]
MERYGLAGGLIKDGVCSCKISKPCVFGDLKAGQTFSADERALMIAMREESHTSQLDSEGTEAEGGGRCRRYVGCFIQRIKLIVGEAKASSSSSQAAPGGCVSLKQRTRGSID